MSAQTSRTAPSASTTVQRRRAALFACALIALAAGGWFGWKTFFPAEDETARYQFATVQRGDIEELVTATGTLQPRDYVDVGAQVSGQLKRFHIEIGSEVKAGDLLAEIDATVLQSRVDATRAQLRNLRAQLLDREAALILAQSQYTRQKNLIAEDATTAESLQNAEAALKSADAQIEALKAQIDQAESNLRADQANLEYTRIEAPIDGTVVSISARQGQTLNANQSAPVILRIADLSTMTVVTQVSEADVSRLKLGMDAYFTTLGGQGRRWSGQLRKIEPTPTVTNNVVLYNALFDVPNPNRNLMTQMTAQVFFVVAAAKGALTVPMSALASPDGPRSGARGGAGPGTMRTARPAGPGAERPPAQGTVRVLSADGGIEERRVTIGVTNRIEAQLLDGVEEGQQVVSGLRLAAPPRADARPSGMPRLPR